MKDTYRVYNAEAGRYDYWPKPDSKPSVVELKFVNSDAKPKTVAVRCDVASIAPIMAWYGAFFAGDRYVVFADGEKLPKDHNGELIAQPSGDPS